MSKEVNQNIGIATHTGNFRLHSLKIDFERIYSGEEFKEAIVLTINRKLIYPDIYPDIYGGEFEVLVNENNITDGKMDRLHESRTYKLHNVQTIELKLLSQDTPALGDYIISVPL